jgi:hypothetical protein
MRERDEGSTARETLAHGESINLQGDKGCAGLLGLAREAAAQEGLGQHGGLSCLGWNQRKIQIWI